MGYPMSYGRMLDRNRLRGDYNNNDPRLADHGENNNAEYVRELATKRLIAGDLRRLESDQRDAMHLKVYAEKAGITTEQAKCVLDLLFGPDWTLSA